MYIMYSKYLTTLCQVPSILNISVRNLRIFPIKKQARDKAGIGKRERLFKQVEEEFENMNFDELETDFMHVGKMHEEYENEVEMFREKEKRWIIKQKYFKESTPNFLTYSEKQQIKYLNNTDPDTWTIEKLSEGFPALPSVIKKVIKSNWVKSADKIKKHDDKVISSWKAFKEGKYTNLPQELVQHLEKFTNRPSNLTSIEPNTKQVTMNNYIRGEFSEIIESYEDMKNKRQPVDNSKTDSDEEMELQKPLKETYLMTKPSNFVNRKHITWRELNKASNNPEDNLPQVHDTQNSVNNISSALQKIKKHESKEIQLNKATKDYSHLIYPQRITIPKGKLKKGCLYKLNDCYYDDDGEFLYRVPGMT